MPETLAERIARKAGQSVLRLTGDVDLGEKNLRELFALAVIQDFARVVAEKIKDEAETCRGSGRYVAEEALRISARVLLSAAGVEGGEDGNRIQG